MVSCKSLADHHKFMPAQQLDFQYSGLVITAWSPVQAPRVIMWTTSPV